MGHGAQPNNGCVFAHQLLTAERFSIADFNRAFQALYTSSSAVPCSRCVSVERQLGQIRSRHYDCPIESRSVRQSPITWAVMLLLHFILLAGRSLCLHPTEIGSKHAQCVAGAAISALDSTRANIITSSMLPVKGQPPTLVVPPMMTDDGVVA